ncbi:sodium/proline symporter PutP [Lysobacter sp. KIS68-7]|uniref:sodium/proline symporter PutP n=1 Tax=Lysobacter sp. KIS68-7 TaxID=2904252 RepID=UPI001E3B3BD8|nr:sodium/proline symporter PutP [Lysobacter sp. KIS68-7]UHQ18254.1 sodium/proline symporter PutP [Lysobacter sp. KIS68-7]
MTASTPLVVTFAIYLLAMIAIGVIAWRSTRSFDDYILGGRSLGSYVTALSAGASDMSGWLLLGLPGALYLGGLSEGWIAVGLVLGAWCNWKFVAGPLRVYTERTRNALTLPDYFTHRFDDRSRVLRVLSALVILVFFAVYCASGIVAGARLFESVFGVPYAQALWWGAAATILYTLIGGFLAVSWTDTVQASLMIFALVLTPVVVILSTGGFHDSLALIESVNPAKLDPFKGGELGLVGIVSLLAWGLGYFGQPHILARFMAADDLRSIPKARRIGMTWMVACLFGAMAVGFFGNAYFAAHGGGEAVQANPERVFIVLSNLLFNPWVAGVLLSAILAAIMSTLSCQLLVCSSALTEDFYKGFMRPKASQRELVWFGRAMVLSVSLLAIWIARDPDSRVLGLVSYAWAGFGAAFGPVVLFSLFWHRMTRNGALAGMVVGAVTVILWKQIAVDQYGSGLYEMVPGFLAASVSIVAASLLDRVPVGAVRDTHDQVHAALAEHGY